DAIHYVGNDAVPLAVEPDIIRGAGIEGKEEPAALGRLQLERNLLILGVQGYFGMNVVVALITGRNADRAALLGKREPGVQVQFLDSPTVVAVVAAAEATGNDGGPFAGDLVDPGADGIEQKRIGERPFFQTDAHGDDVGFRCDAGPIGIAGAIAG